jgi:hypothetical protein
MFFNRGEKMQKKVNIGLLKKAIMICRESPIYHSLPKEEKKESVKYLLELLRR